LGFGRHALLNSTGREISSHQNASHEFVLPGSCGHGGKNLADSFAVGCSCLDDDRHFDGIFGRRIRHILKMTGEPTPKDCSYRAISVDRDD